MMGKGKIFYNDLFAGILEKTESGEYIFTYDEEYMNNPFSESISLSISKKQKAHHSKIMFPFFFGLLSEGSNKKLQCRLLKIDEEDHFTLLIKTAGYDTIGPVTVKEHSE